MKNKLSHSMCCGLCRYGRNPEKHFIFGLIFGHTHDPTVSDWLRIIYGKFIKIIPKNLNHKTLRIFDRGCFFLCFNPRFNLGEMV